MKAMSTGEAYLLAYQGVERNLGSAADAHRHDCPPRFDDRKHVAERDTDAGAFEARVEIAFFGGVEPSEPVRLGAGVDGRVRAHLDGGSERRISEVNGDNFLRARKLRSTHD